MAFRILTCGGAEEADCVFRVGDSLGHDFQNGRSYHSLEGSRIAVPGHEPWRPRRGFLAGTGRRCSGAEVGGHTTRLEPDSELRRSLTR